MKDKNQIISSVAMAVTAFVVYLLMRKYVLSNEITRQDYIIGGAIAIGLVVGQMFRNRRNKSK